MHLEVAVPLGKPEKELNKLSDSVPACATIPYDKMDSVIITFFISSPPMLRYENPTIEYIV